MEASGFVFLLRALFRLVQTSTKPSVLGVCFLWLYSQVGIKQTLNFGHPDLHPKENTSIFLNRDYFRS